MPVATVWEDASTTVDFVVRLSMDLEQERPQRRSDPRVPLSVPVSIRQLGESLNPIGPPIPSVSRDLSPGGIGIFHIEPIESEFVQLDAVSFEGGESISAVGRVRFSEKAGQFFHTGIQFLIGVDESF